MKTTYTYTTQAQVREAFWESHLGDPAFKRKSGWTQNDYPTDTRVAWCDFVEYLNRDSQISDALRQRVTL